MGKRFFLMLFPLMVLSVAAEAAINAQYNFESGVPGFVKVQGQGTVTSSADKYKDGSHSLKFEWNGPASLVFENFLDMEASFKVNGAGIIIWIYNTVPSDEPLRFTFWNWSGEEICHFDFNIGYVGWRTAWMKYIDMKTPDGGYYGDIKASERLKNVARMTVEMPESLKSGTIYVDRLSFPAKKLHDQITPDMQIPDNNNHLRRNMWHWCRLWEWEQYPGGKDGQVHCSK